MAYDPETAEFEQRVREIARILWPSAEWGGASVRLGRERDGVFVTEDVVHIVEATTSRRRDTVEENARKTISLIKELRKDHPNKAMRGWIVTRDEPTADQRDTIERQRKFGVVICSYAQFSSRIVDASTYLERRLNYGFGSARNLVKLDDFKNVGDYIEMDILEEETPKGDQVNKIWSIRDIINCLSTERNRIVFIGDFGSGKSMTLREVFLRLKASYNKNRTSQFPVYLNLRDHWAQRNPVEVLERHAREIGYPNERQLVMAWRAGFVILILDGFDEVATEGWTGKGQRLRELRRKAMIVIRKFVSESPRAVPVLIAGRSNFFDSQEELRTALGTGDNALYLTLNDFSTEQIERYLSKLGVHIELPDWLPSRPLLVGHLAARGILQNVLGNERTESRAEGWRSLLRMICERDSTIEEANVEPAELQQVIERIATHARGQSDGLGPIQSAAIFECFRSVVGRLPDDAAQVLLLRLPGLGAYSSSDTGSRTFIDEDLADTARAGDVVRYFMDPYGKIVPELTRAQIPIGPLAASVAALCCRERKISAKSISVALAHAAENDQPIGAVDAYRTLQALGEAYSGSKVDIEGAFIDELEISASMPASNLLTFKNSAIERVLLDQQIDPAVAPRFVDCIIERVLGRVGRADVPGGIFNSGCEIAAFSSFDPTTSSIMRMPIEIGTKVLLTVLKKLFLQPGSGRQESALTRGLDQAARSLVRPVLDEVERGGLARPLKLDRRTVWVPTRSQHERVFSILQAPSQSRDPIVLACAGLRAR